MPAKYMPQIKSDEDDMFWNVWFSPCDYTRAKEIKQMFIDRGTPRDRIRIVAVV